MKDYAINVFYSEEDECWVATIPDLWPCSAFGDTPQEALAEVLVAKEGWLETAQAHDMPIPEARYRPEVRKGA